jgi:hypothetical protein
MYKKNIAHIYIILLKDIIVENVLEAGLGLETVVKEVVAEEVVEVEGAVEDKSL